jgi:hypothetical protein
MKQKQKQSLMHELVAFALLILNAFARALQYMGIKKDRRIEKVNVEQE